MTSADRNTGPDRSAGPASGPGPETARPSPPRPHPRPPRRPGGPWGHPRAVYLQNASDPVVRWSPDLLLDRPARLDEPRGPDVTPEVTWFPFVSFRQTSVDMAVSYGVDAPHGHRYGAGSVDGWAAVYGKAEYRTAEY